jgi:putative transposase
VRPTARRQVVGQVRQKRELSERRVCSLFGFPRSTMRYQTERVIAPELVADLRQVAMERPRFGYRRLHVMLRRKGWTVNKKLVLRLVRENGCW